MTKRRQHRFGGAWTTQKLEVLKRYLAAYTTALKNTPFTTAYIDAFAGSGYRTPSGADTGDTFFPDFQDEAQAYLDGSARLALQVEPRFDRYIFVERSVKRCKDLESLKGEFPDKASDIVVQQGDANAIIQDLCSKNWDLRRAVLFLDPYGLQVEWRTIEAVAKTGAIDMWLLFPLGIGVNRLLTKSGDIPESWQRRLDTLLGTPAWRTDFYVPGGSGQQSLFGQPEEPRVKARVERIGEFFNDRLKGIFPGVAPKPLALMNSSGCPLYLLCFAAGSRRGAPIAVKIARHLLESG